MIARFLLPALLLAHPVQAQSADDIRLMNASLAAVLAVCVPAVDGKFDMNDRAALRDYGLAPASAETEAQLRKDYPGIEYAGVVLPAGSVSIGYLPGQWCQVKVDGATRVAIRDELVKEMLDTNVRATRSTTAEGTDLLLFHFTAYTIQVRTTRTGEVGILVHRE